MKMIDVGEKDRSSRIAIARAELRCSRETLKLLNEGRLEKGDVLAAARRGADGKRKAVGWKGSFPGPGTRGRSGVGAVRGHRAPLKTLWARRPACHRFPAAVTACRYPGSAASPEANTPGTDVFVV